MFKKMTTVACSLAALLALGCENNETGLEEPDATVTPAETEPLQDDQYVDPLDNTTTDPAGIRDDSTSLETPRNNTTGSPGTGAQTGAGTQADLGTQPSSQPDAGTEAGGDADVVDEVPADSLPENEEE